MYQDRTENFKMELKSATKLKLGKLREELASRHTEHILSEELRSNQVEIEIMSQQLEEVKQEVSKMKNQISMIEICEASEKIKIDSLITNIQRHQTDYDTMFSKENKKMETHKLDLKKREEQEKELEQQKSKIMEEKNDLLQQEAKTIEDECETIEKECAVFTKRNKAIMLKLRRKLIESEDKRRALIKEATISRSS